MGLEQCVARKYIVRVVLAIWGILYSSRVYIKNVLDFLDNILLHRNVPKIHF